MVTADVRQPRRPARWTTAPRLLERSAAVVVAAALAVEAVVLLQSSRTLGGWVAWTLAVAALVTCFRYPLVGLALAAASPLASALLGWWPIATWSVACFLALTLTLRGLPGVLAGIVIGSANLVAVGVHGGSVLPTVNPEASIACVSAVMMAAIGSAVRGHQRYWSELEQRARDAEATRDAVVSRTVAEERVRIARDLHDSLGHKIAVLSMHLGAAEARLPADAEVTRTALAQVRGDVQSLLAETQQVVRVLRVGDEPESLLPNADHRRIAGLIDEFRAAGLMVEASVDDLATVELTPAASAAAYRIVQESLTNAQRHGVGPVWLRVDADASGLRIEAMNARRGGRSSSVGVGGHGLVGMRARPESAGGKVETVDEGGRFQVRAELPVAGRGRS